MHIKHAYYLGIFLLSLIVVFSCNKEKEEVYANQLPADQDTTLIYVTDTISLTTSLAFESAQITYDPVINNTGYKALGFMNDPIFGSTTTSFVFEVMPIEDETNIGSLNSSDVSSISLDIELNKSYGEILDIQTLNVYELNDALSSQEYKTDDDFSGLYNSGSLVGSIDFYPTDSISSISIKLSSDLSDKLIASEIDSINLDESTSHAEFIDIIKGFYIEADASNSALFQIHSSNIKLNLYCSDTLTKSFEITNECISANTISHDYTNTNLPTDSLMYVQGVQGARTKIEFPYLSNFANNEITAILGAKLVIPNKTQESSDSIYTLPEQLMLRGIGSNIHEIEDYKIDPDYFDGNYANGVYTFNITNFVQKVINKEHNNSIYLQSFSSLNSVERAVLKNENHSDKLKLIITYSKL